MVTTFKNIGLVLSSVIGPGPVTGSQRLYASIAYDAGAFDILAIDPETGNTTVLHSPVPGETAVWSMAVGSDGNIYMGTAPSAHFLKLDTARGMLVDLGIPSSSEQYIWAVALGSDHRLYGGTYPHCKLVAYDPVTGRLADLGRLDATQEYARYLAGTKDGFLYAGVGSAVAEVVAYQIGSGRMQQILPQAAQVAGFAHTYAAADGNIYSQTPSLDFQISGWQANQIPGSATPDPSPPMLLSDGRSVALDEENGALILRVRSSTGDAVTTFTLDYAGEENQLFRIGLGPDGMLYGSGALPSDLVRIHPGENDDYIGSLGNGEAYSMLPWRSNLLLATYADTATLVSFNPRQPFSTDTGSGNPQLVAIPDGDMCWRPQAMVAGQDGLVYVGAQAGYGELGGPFMIWNPADGSVRHLSVIPNQSVVSLTAWNSFVVGGTTIQGGQGSTPIATDAELFLWDTKQQATTWRGVPVPGAQTIMDLIAASNGLVYGFADETLFEFDPSLQKVLRTRGTPVSGLIYNSVGLDAMGRIFGLSSQGIFVLDTAGLQATMVASPPTPITGGFALSGGSLDFIAGTAVYAYGLPDMGFDLQNSATGASTIAGGGAAFTLTVTARGGFDGSVSFSCTGLPLGTGCTFSPPSVASSGTSRLTISTTGPAASAFLLHERNTIQGLAAPGLCVIFVSIAVWRRKYAGMLLALVVVLYAVSGCSVTHLTPGLAGPQTNQTPPGTYSITVHATGSAGGRSITQTTPVTLTVN